MVEVRIKEKPERPRDDDHVRQVNKPRNFFQKRWNDLIRAEDWMSEKSGLGNFVDNIKRFQKADRAYTEDQGLGFLEKIYKSPYKKDVGRWAGNWGYSAAEGLGDMLELGWRVPTAFAGFDTLPGDHGVMGKYFAGAQEYDPKWNLFGLDVPNPFADELKISQLEQAIPDIERDIGLDIVNMENFEDVLGVTNFQNYLRNHGLDLGGLNREERLDSYSNWMADKYMSQFKDADDSRLMTSGDYQYAIPNEFLENLDYWDPYLSLDQDMMNTIVGDYTDDYRDYETGQLTNLSNEFTENLYNQRDQMLMDQFGLDKDELLFAMTKGEANNLDLGIFEDLLRENTMPFMEDDFRLDYETDEAQKIYEENPFWSEGLPSLLGWSAGLKALKSAGKINAGPLSTTYRNVYPGLSGTGGTGVPWKWGRIGSIPGASVNIPGRSMWQFPALTYGTALRETGDE